VDANGTRFQLLLGKDDWGACSSAETPPGAVPHPLSEAWGASPLASAPPDLVWGNGRGELTLRPLLLRITPSRGHAAPLLDARRGAARDRYGNWYWIAPGGTELLANSAGTGNTSHFWSPGDGLACPTTSRFGGFQTLDPPAAPPALALAGLAVTEEHYLVVGVLDPAGLLLFDLYTGGPPRQVFWPAAVPFVPFDMAPAPGGGVWILDRLNARYWALDRQFRVIARGQADAIPPSQPDAFQPQAGGAVRPTPAPAFPEGIRLDAASPLAARDPIAIEALPDGTVLVLDRNPGRPHSLVCRYLFGQQLGGPVPTVIPADLIEDGTVGDLDIVAHDFAFVPERTAADGTQVPDRLYVVAANGAQSFLFLPSLTNGQLVMQAQTDDLPMRLFGGKGLVTAGNQPYYDFADRWVPLGAQRRPRYAAVADLYTPAGVPDDQGSPPPGTRPPFDGRVPDCIWHRLMLDACIPPETQIMVWSRAANDPRDMPRTAWQQEPPLYLRGDGSEQPFIAPRTAPGDGTWELLFQRARGRYLQLRLQICGNRRSSPRIRALRAYYPRFSYLERYLPGVYRQDRESASFLDRFLANPEGFYTAIEGRIAAVQMLFDPASAPAADLAWLAGWFGVVLDPLWDERKQRLFLTNAMVFFQYRGTARGLEMALRLAHELCADESVFNAAAPTMPARSFRIVEAWQARRTPGLLPSAPPGGPLPGRGPAPTRWTPDQGGAALNRLYTQALVATGIPLGGPAAFPLVAPADPAAGAAWKSFAQSALGFVPSTSLVDAGRWQDFLARRYRRVSAINQTYQSDYATFAAVPLPQVLPPDGAPLLDWYQFQAIVLVAAGSAHRFTVLLPAPPSDPDGSLRQKRLALTRRVIDLEKPAHTVYDVQFYWAYFRVGAVRLGEDSVIDRGSRAPELLPPLVLGQGFLAGSFLAPGFPQDVCQRPVLGRDRVAPPRVMEKAP
jgi:phage tail-like protein